MPEAFEPYLRWLGIRDPGRPPNHYRLLGLDLFENDSDVIAVAADRQMAHVRTFQTGQFATLSQRVLNELAAARICLLKPEKKAVYDALLKKQLGSAIVAARAKPQADAAALPVAARATAAASDGAKATKAVESDDAGAEDSFDLASLAPAATAGKPAVRKSAVSARKSESLAPWIGLAVAGFLLVIGVIAVLQMGGSPEVATTDGQKDRSSAPLNAAAPSSSIQSKGSADKKPAPAVAQPHEPNPATIPADHGNASTPTEVRPASTKPRPKNSPPEPPVHSPRDVIRVDNPAQPVPAPPSPAKPVVAADAPTEVAQADTGKTGPPDESKTGTHDHETHPTLKNPASPADQASDSKPKRAPVPSNEQIAASEAKVQKLFNVAAAKKPDERAALAKTLYEQGTDPNNQEIDRYALLRMAMKDAVALGDADLAIKATDKLGEKFDFNALDEKVSVLAALGKTVRTPGATQVVLGTAQELLESALTADDFDTAKSLSQLAAGLAAKSGDAALARQIRQRLAEIDQIKKEYAKAVPAWDTLRTKRDDPEANYVWGYYVGPIKGDFDRGLPYLAKGSETGPSDLAKKELGEPTDPKAQTALADGWLEFSNKEREPALAHLRSHAAGWYSQAAGHLTGLEKKRVEDQLAKLEGPTQTPSVGGKAFVRSLTTGSWAIKWQPNPQSTIGYCKSGFSYDPMIFYPDGRCTNPYCNGTWIQDGTRSVTVRYVDKPSFLQRFVLDARGQLEGQHCDPADKLQNYGLGAKNAAGRN